MGTIKPGTRVYSYIRFSTPRQEWGKSEQRQVEDAENWAKAHKCTIDPMRMADKGYSGFHGEHRKSGTLGVFLKLVEKGEVPAGSILLVENIDRLGREGAHKTIRHVIFPLFDYDITIQTLGYDPRTYNKDTIDEEISELVGELKRAYRESKRKQDMRRFSWKDTREKLKRGEKVRTGRLPTWLHWVDGEIKAIPEAADAINRVFDLRLKPWSNGEIVRYLNLNSAKLKLWTPDAKGWQEDYVRKVLRWPAVIGHYQAFERIDGKRVLLPKALYKKHYPPIVDEDKFYAVQQLAKGNRGTGGRPNDNRNVLLKLVRCAYCGGPMHYRGGVRPVLYCLNGKWRRGCTPREIRYDECQTLILENCRDFDANKILPTSEDRRRQQRDASRALAGAEGKLADLKLQRANLFESLKLAATDQIRKDIQAELASLDALIGEQKQEVEKRNKESENLAQSERDVKEWQQGLDALMPEIDKKENVAIRQQTNYHLRKLIQSIEVFAHGHDQLFDADEEAKAERSVLRQDRTGKLKALRSSDPDAYWRELRRHPTMKELGERERMAELFGVLQSLRTGKRLDRAFRAFQEWLTERRMSRYGRFLRVHFTTGETVDMVAPGSLGSGEKLVTLKGKQVWKYVDPNLDETLEVYRRVLKRRPVRKTS